MFIERNTDSWGTLSTKRFKCMEYLYLCLFEPCFNIAIKEISDINEIVHGTSLILPLQILSD